MTNTDDDWDWEVLPEQGATSKYSGVDLTGASSIGNRIAKLRSEAGLSEQDVEDYAGIKKQDLLAIEAGLLQMSTDVATQLALVLGVGVDELTQH